MPPKHVSPQACIALIALAIGFIVLTLGALRLPPGAIERAIEDWGPWSAAASIALMVLHSFLPLPAEVIAMANGMIFGAVWGTVITWTGAMLGACLSFGLARWLGWPFVRRHLAPAQWATLETWAAGNGAATLFVARLIPVISFNLINYAAGLSGIRWPVFLWTTGLGILPLTVLSVTLGDGLVTASVQAWALIAFGAVALTFAVQRWRRRAAARKPWP